MIKETKKSKIRIKSIKPKVKLKNIKPEVRMVEKKLGRLKKINLRDFWKHEALDFTEWLAQEENLSLLSDEIGIDIKLIQTEANIGKFNVDILAEEENTGRKIIIENQLELTNHDHLGKLITYASGYDSEINIWIVKDIKDEHKQAIDWLNEHTDEKINFFIIKIELWQIEDSSVAPKFQIISKPNDWAKIIKKSIGGGKLTEAKILQFDFWNKFKEYAKNKKTKLRLRATSPQHWYDISFGSSEAHISLTINTREDLLGCEIYIPDSKDLFYKLQNNKEGIEKEIGQGLKWMELPGRKASRIKLSIETEDEITQINNWNNYFEELIFYAEEFQRVFPKYIKKAKLRKSKI